MGAWSEAILGNDTSCEVHDRFIELYNSGERPNDIAYIILKEQKENIQYDRTNVWLALALSCWECKTLTKEIFDEVKNIVETKEDIKFNTELDAGPAFLKKRQRVLEDFIIKISKEKEKPRLRKKVPIQLESVYVPGMCLCYKNPDGKYVGIFVVASEHYKNKGSIEFWFLDFESDNLPGIDMYSNGRLFGLKKLGEEWGDKQYTGNRLSITYEKANKAFFFLNIPKVFQIIGTLKPPADNKLADNYRWQFMDLRDPCDIITNLENCRADYKLKYGLSELTLIQLLNEIGVDVA